MHRQRSMCRRISVILIAGLALALAPARADDEPTQPAAGEPATLWIVGNRSSVGRGWGQKLDEFFDAGKIRVANSAAACDDLPGVVTTGKWTEIADALKPGDFVILHFHYSPPSSVFLGPSSPTSASRIKQAPNNKKKLDSASTSQDVALTMKEQAGALRTMIRDAGSRQARVILCSPVPVVYQPIPTRAPDHDQFPPRVSSGNSEWLAMLRSRELSRGAFFLDLAGIGEKFLSNLDRETLDSIARGRPSPARKDPASNDNDDIFYSRLVLAALRSIPSDPLAPYLNDAGHEITPRSGDSLLHRFTNNEGKTIDGELISADGESVVIRLAPSNRKVTVNTAMLSESDRQFIQRWKTENPSFQLTYEATKISEKSEGASLDERTYFYRIRIGNPSNEATPKLDLFYHYNRKVRQRGPLPMRQSPRSADIGSLVVPPIPAGGSVTVETAATRLANKKSSSKQNIRMSNGRTQETVISSSLRESLIGIAFDLYLGKKMVSRYRANGFMTDIDVRPNRPWPN